MFNEFIDNFDSSTLIYILGVGLFGYWLFDTSLGRRALADSKPRRNSMPVYFPLAVILLWFFLGSSLLFAANEITSNMSEHTQVLAQSIAFSIASVVSALVTLVLVRKYFARGLKGFGLNFKKIFKDAFYAGPYLLAVWPVAIAVLIFTGIIGKFIYGTDYSIQPHEEIELVRTYTQPTVRAVILFGGAIITPFFEEIVFRGLIQTTIRSYTSRTWMSIIFASGIFAIFHAQGAHWPAIFVLGILFGYAYEKSGSLFRPIFIHMLFNGLTILAVIIQS